MRPSRAVLLVFLPFATGYYLAYLFRTINALIAGRLTSELALGAAQLGFLTSGYFLTFALAQLPLGVWLDRYGPRRVQTALLLVAAIGAVLFGLVEDFGMLVLARALIGLGVAAALPAGFKALVLWFPKERLPLANGCMVMLGALGAVTATAPAEIMIQSVGWRSLFLLLGLLSAGCALLTFFVVPEVGSPHLSRRPEAKLCVRSLAADRRFWRLAPLSGTCLGTAWGLQGLWAAPWLTDVEGLERPAVVTHLFVMALGLCAGALCLGGAAQRAGRCGVRPERLLELLCVVFIGVQLALIFRLPVPSYVSWPLIAGMGAAPVLSYASLSTYFPRELSGRANGLLGTADIGTAFALQYASGLVIHYWEPQGGHYPLPAYQAAFGLNVALQVAALFWSCLPQLRTIVATSRSGIRYYGSAVQSYGLLAPLKACGRSVCVRLSWQHACTISFGLSSLLGLGAIGASRATVVSYVIEGERPSFTIAALNSREQEELWHAHAIAASTPSISPVPDSLVSAWVQLARPPSVPAFDIFPLEVGRDAATSGVLATVCTGRRTGATCGPVKTASTATRVRLHLGCRPLSRCRTR